MQQYPLITIVGGSGFLGRHLVKQLAQAGFRIRVIGRDAVAGQFLRMSGVVGQIICQYGDITKPETLEGKFDGSWAVINLASVMIERGRQTFTRVNEEGARRVAEYAARVGASRMIHVSALGIEHAEKSRYARSKKAGEDAVRMAYPMATIIRPGLMVGPEDQFFQRFGRMSLVTPLLPLIGGGVTQFQPTLVTDVATAIVTALQLDATAGHVYELAGPELKSFREWLELMGRITNRRLRFVSLPWGLARVIGRLASILPFTPPITADQVTLLQYHNLPNPGSEGYEALGIKPASVSEALPILLSRFVRA